MSDITTSSKAKQIIPAVQFDNIVFGYSAQNEPTIKGVSFKINEGDYVCIVGSNGSGKSTISRILVGLLKPWSGTVSIFGTPITMNTIKKLRDDVGIVFQNPDNQFIGLTAEDDIAFGLENRKVNPCAMWDIIKTASSIVNVTHLLSYNASKLSGGQKQRVAIASVLAMNPKIIVFDESTSMLDPTAKGELKKLMLLLRNKFHKTIISITHDMEEIVLADKVMVINKGTLQAYDEPETVFANQDFLRDNSLDIPYCLQLSKYIHSYFDNVPLTLDENKLLEEINKICQQKK